MLGDHYAMYNNNGQKFVYIHEFINVVPIRKDLVQNTREIGRMNTHITSSI